MRKKITWVFKGILFIGFTIQIGFGIAWACCNFTSVQAFAESESVVYGALLALAGRHAWAVYALQLLAAYGAGRRFLRVLRPAGRFGSIWGALALLTFPMALQCHLALLPWSFVGSLVMLEWSFAVESLRRGADVRQTAAFWRMAFCWLPMALLLPEYRLLGGVPVLLTFLFCLWRLRRQAGKMGRFALLVIAYGCLAVGAGTLVQRASGQEERSLSFALACRTAWPFILSDFSGWPEEVQEVLAQDMREITFCPDNMDRIMKPLMEETFGEEQADAYYLEIARNAWEHRARVILTHVRWDVIGYAAAPAALQAQLRGGYYDSYSGRNYEIMREKAPLLTRYYVDYSCWWFGICIGAALLLTVLFCIGEKRFVWKDFGRGLLVCILSSGALVAWYTLQGAGQMDYKASFAVSSLWLVWALTAMREEGTGR